MIVIIKFHANKNSKQLADKHVFNIVFTKSTHIWQDEKDHLSWVLQYPKFAQRYM